MRLITAVVAGASLLFICGASGDPATRPAATQAGAYVPAEADLKAAFDTLMALRSIHADAPIASIRALQIRPARWTDEQAREDIRAGHALKIETVDGHLGDGVATFILRINPDEGGRQLGVSRLVRTQGQWKVLVQPASRYRDGELSPEQFKALQAQIPWIDQRMADLRAK